MKAGRLSATALCGMLSVSRASFYRWLEPDARREQQCQLQDEIERIALRWPTYGSRRIQAELARRGREVGRERVQRIVREAGLLCQRRPNCWLATTQASHSLPLFPNLAPKLELTRLNQLWVADITYIRLRQDFVFLAAILDAFSRRVIGWALQPKLEAKLCLAALEQAIRCRQPQPGLIHHSDRGVQYCCQDYVQLLQRHQIRGSMSRKGNPFDNARIESFWKTLKSEQVYRDDYRTVEQARQQIARFLDVIYNRRRLHSALGYRPPVEFEQAMRQEVHA